MPTNVRRVSARMVHKWSGWERRVGRLNIGSGVTRYEGKPPPLYCPLAAKQVILQSVSLSSSLYMLPWIRLSDAKMGSFLIITVLFLPWLNCNKAPCPTCICLPPPPLPPYRRGIQFASSQFSACRRFYFVYKGRLLMLLVAVTIVKGTCKRRLVSCLPCVL